MKNLLLAFTLIAGVGTGALSASSICPSTNNTTSDCDYLITVGTNNAVSVSGVAGSTAFNGPITFSDGSSDPGGNASLIGVVNDSTQSLKSFTLEGSGANSGIFDFSFNGVCVYTKAAYCGTASTGYEGPTTTFSNLQSTVLFQTNMGTVSFAPSLASGGSTYFSIQDSAADLNANGGLKVSNVMFASSSSTPEPADFALLASGISVLLLFRRKLSSNL